MPARAGQPPCVGGRSVAGLRRGQQQRRQLLRLWRTAPARLVPGHAHQRQCPREPLCGEPAAGGAALVPAALSGGLPRGPLLLVEPVPPPLPAPPKPDAGESRAGAACAWRAGLPVPLRVASVPAHTLRPDRHTGAPRVLLHTHHHDNLLRQCGVSAAPELQT